MEKNSRSPSSTNYSAQAARFRLCKQLTYARSLSTNSTTDTMSDLIRTIESDDEDFQVSLPASTSTAVAVADTKKRKREGGNRAAKAGKNDSKRAKDKAGSKNDVKGKGKQVETEDTLAGEFQFDALGGGEYLSRGARLGDAWVSRRHRRFSSHLTK